MTHHRFINDILKPWDELNLLLSQQYAFQPDLSDITRLAGSIAVSIRHQVDSSELNDKQINELSRAHQIISDAGDYWKHGELKKEERNSPITVAAAFEYREDKTFRFIRNIVTIEHKSLGSHDFMAASSEAARFWMSQNGYSLQWEGVPSVAPFVYNNAAKLKFNPKYCFSMSSVQLKFFKMTDTEGLIPFDPPNVRFEVYE
ncbi:MAG: hypothetical protein Q9M21_01205 [Mariprofundaceae bacterium]|nr:hypothetical protein [Mariprofundaceae bacterium]